MSVAPVKLFQGDFPFPLFARGIWLHQETSYLHTQTHMVYFYACTSEDHMTCLIFLQPNVWRCEAARGPKVWTLCLHIFTHMWTLCAAVVITCFPVSNTSSCIRQSDAESDTFPSIVEHCPEFSQGVQRYGKFTKMTKIHPQKTWVGCLKEVLPGLPAQWRWLYAV